MVYGVVDMFSLPGWRVDAKVLLVYGVESSKVLHVSNIQVNQDYVPHLPALAVHLSLGPQKDKT